MLAHPPNGAGRSPTNPSRFRQIPAGRGRLAGVATSPAGPSAGPEARRVVRWQHAAPCDGRVVRSGLLASSATRTHRQHAALLRCPRLGRRCRGALQGASPPAAQGGARPTGMTEISQRSARKAQGAPWSGCGASDTWWGGPRACTRGLIGFEEYVTSETSGASCVRTGIDIPLQLITSADHRRRASNHSYFKFFLFEPHILNSCIPSYIYGQL